MDNILQPEDAQVLENKGDLQQVSDDRLIVRKRRFHNRSSEDSEQQQQPFSPPYTNIISPPSSFIEDDDVIEIPKQLTSRATLEFVGYNTSTASIIWSRWMEMPASMQEDFGFYDFIKGSFFDGVKEATYGRENYRAAFEAYGLDAKLIEGLLDERFDSLLHTQSASAWAQEVIANRYHFLQYGQTASESRQRQRSTGKAPSRVPSYTYSSGSGKTFPGIGNEPGHTVVWKATLRSKVQRMKSEADSPDRLDLRPILSTAPTDFSGRKSGLYFTPQLQGALFYANYLKKHYPVEDVVLIRLRIPNQLLESKNTPYILRYPSEQFKKVVWLSRRQHRYTPDLKDISQARCIIGDTTKGTENPYQKMKSHTEVSESNLVFLEGENDDGSRTKMTQYFFTEDFEDTIVESLKQEDLTVHHWQHPEREVDVNV